MTNPALWLTDAEVDDLCAGLRLSKAKVRYLQRMGLTVNEKPNGRPLIVRSHAEAVLSGAPPLAANDSSDSPKKRLPNRDALILAFGSNR